MIYDLAIIGGGPAGVSAGVYASRKQLRSILITESFGGQSVVSSGIENWIGTLKISGEELAKNLEEHLRAYAGEIVDIKTGTRAEKVFKNGEIFSIKLSNGEEIQTKTVLVATGSSRKKLTIPGADKFENKGIIYCASCDGPMFAGEDVVVIGGGNAGFESAAQLLAYSKSVTLLNRSDRFKADEVTVETLLKDPKMKAIKNAVPKEIKGDAFVTGIVYTDTKTGEDFEIPTKGIFVEIGNMPATDMVEGLVEMDEIKRVKIDPWTQRTSVSGIWCAGDCSNILYHQNNIASGDAVRALEDIYLFIKTGK